MGIADRLFRMKQEKADANLKAGEIFLQENQKRPGVQLLPGGLQYEILVEGKGPRPTVADEVKCHYHGTLIDGTVFDSSVQRGQPASFPLNRVIRGWTETLVHMPVGSKWRIYIPPQLAYGNQQAGAKIGPNSTLIFEVELLEIR